MKSSFLLVTFAAFSVIFGVTALAQEVEKTVALRVNADGAQRYISIVPHGGINAQSSTITARQIFVIVDENGGDLADGDPVHIKFVPKDVKPTWWQEGTENNIARFDKKGAQGQFTIKKRDQGIVLQAPSGKFVTVIGRTEPLGLSDTVESATVLEVVENPTAATAPASN